jgi:hypothetical protein
MSPDTQIPRKIPDEETKHLAYAQASIMMLECLLLTLVEQRILGKEQLIAAIETVIATKRQMLAEHDNPEISTVAIGVLGTLANSVSAAEA